MLGGIILLNKKIGKRIQARREEVGMSQEQLAEAVELTPLSISYIETGRNAPSMAKFIRIANALKVSADMLLADVIDYGYKVKSSQFGDIIEQLSPDNREQVFDVISALIKRY